MISYEVRDVLLQRLKYAVRRDVTMEAAATVPTLVFDRVADRMVAEVRRDVLAERLPTQSLRVVGDVPRHASWWDHLKATYRGRWWWPRALSVVRYTADPAIVSYVDVRTYWAYPEAPARLLGEPGFGRPVLVTYLEEVDDGT